MQPQDDTVDNEQQTPSSNTPDKKSIEANGELGRRDDDGSTPWEYTVDYIVQHVGNGRQRK